MVMLKIENLHFSYGNGGKVLRGIDLRLEEGEVVTLTGPNGSGKSTLLKCICGINPGYTGRIEIGGRDLREMPSRERARLIAYVPQSEDRGFPCTVYDAVLMGRRPYIQWSPTREDHEIVEAIIEAMGLGGLVARDVNRLSGGQRQKVLIARALAQLPSVLLLDEPTSNLDIKHQLEVMDVVRELTGHGVSSLVAIHDLNMASRFGDRCVLLHEGRVYAEGDWSEVLSRQNLMEIYGVSCCIIHRDGHGLVVPESGDGGHLGELSWLKYGKGRWGQGCQ